MSKLKVPNWRREVEYEFIKELTPKQLAWEFLRRSVPYRKCHQKAVKLIGRAREKRAEEILKRFQITALVSPDVSPLPPDQSKKLFVLNKLVPHLPREKNGEWSIVINRLSSTQVAMTFDLSVSIPEQVKVVRKRLDMALEKMVAAELLVRPTKNAKSTELYARYLRVSDANYSGADDDEIVKVLAGEVKLKKNYSTDNLRKDKGVIKHLKRAYRSIAGRKKA